MGLVEEESKEKGGRGYPKAGYKGVKRGETDRRSNN
jgi:hypothetical protein